MTETEEIIVVALFEVEVELIRFFLTKYKEIINLSDVDVETIEHLEMTVNQLKQKLGIEE